ncbi:FlgO family outer membrane protein [Bowmanella dokdonensis]|uniref:FlgO domain-containing protein n=1 Tax=Bowmanella dokdonensis TaxID=751969 RepID=A0A939DPQ8_9ALTE|nr:FlgO family outer membrane protein [Bowmanella dokdonensis]MBN7826699.1 hypothetical protein [Bowmanella dokdonensis]
MNKTLILPLLLSGLVGCTSFGQQAVSKQPVTAPDSQQVNIRQYQGPSQQMSEDQASQFYKASHPSMDSFGATGGAAQAWSHSNPNSLYRGRELTKHIGVYVQNLTQDLISNMEYLSDKTPVGITHFALLDSDLQQTNLLGFQLAESFMHELHKFRIPVIDYKSTEYIRVTQDGDFLLTRDYLELKDRAPVKYVLTGTLVKHQGGYLVNARVLGIESKAVVATAQTLIPFYVAEALLPSARDEVDGVKLKQG